MLVANVFTYVNYNIYVAVKRLKSKKTEKAEKKDNTMEAKATFPNFKFHSLLHLN